MRTVKCEVNQKNVNKLISICSSKANSYGLEFVDSFEGSLLDNYIFINTLHSKNVGIVFGKTRKVRKYIIIREIYLNEWSSGLEAYQTDSEKQYQDFMHDKEEAEAIPMF